MSDDTLHVIVAVENARLRQALQNALEPLPCSPELVMPERLLQREFSGYNLIFLETSDDIERLVATAQKLWDVWGATGRAGVQFLSYSTPEVTPDTVVLRLWSIGPELTVIVQIWTPDTLPEDLQGAYNLTKRILGT